MYSLWSSPRAKKKELLYDYGNKTFWFHIVQSSTTFPVSPLLPKSDLLNIYENSIKIWFPLTYEVNMLYTLFSCTTPRPVQPGMDTWQDQMALRKPSCKAQYQEECRRRGGKTISRNGQDCLSLLLTERSPWPLRMAGNIQEIIDDASTTQIDTIQPQELKISDSGMANITADVVRLFSPRHQECQTPGLDGRHSAVFSETWPNLLPLTWIRYVLPMRLAGYWK